MLTRHCGAMQETAIEGVAHLAETVRLRKALPTPAMCRALREAAGVSAAQVAAPVGVTRQTVSKWELGTRTPRGEHLRRYLDVLDALRVAAA